METTTATDASPDVDRAKRVRPRLLNMRQAAEYLGCSFWTARDYILQGLIPVVDMPPLRAREGDRQRKTLRRVLVDRADLDAFVESRKRHSDNGLG
jgi:predicted site-specific integrase-resolvase